MEKLITWLNKNNVNTSNLHIVNQLNNERGVVSAKNIQSGNFVFLIPKHLIITNRVAEQISEIKELDNIFSETRATYKSPTEMNIIKITIFMLYAEAYEEVMKDVDWTPYFDTLPETLDHIPIFWDDELNYLKGSYLFDRIKKRNKIIKEEFKLLRKHLIDFREFSFYEYQRMRSLVSSRNFKLTIDNDIVSAMVPFADMLNHSNTCQTRWSFNNELQSYQMVAKENINKGDEITDSYGIKPMDNYFMFYGFVLPDSEVRINIKINDFQVYITNDIVSNKFNSLLNFIRQKLNENSDSFNYKNRYNEIKVMKTIYKLLEQLKKKYPHTKNYYIKNKTKGSQNKKNAYTIISGELTVIEELMKKIKIIIDYLNGKNVDFQYNDVEKYLVSNVIRQ